MNYNDNYLLKVYAGWLGKVIGVQHGACIENWDHEIICKMYGEITDYIYPYRYFAADDDLNGPIFFKEVLKYVDKEATIKEMSLAWKNYISNGHGFFWWGGLNISTEHTAFVNLQKGIDAPKSGSAEVNGKVLSEQIGGQIFSDVWGLLAPNAPKEAADLAEMMARVSHDGEGVNGARFIAACVSLGFNESDIQLIIKKALEQIDEKSEYFRAVSAVINFYEKHPQDWRDCLAYIHENFGYDKYPGVCHIIPNTCVIILSLLYGKGDFSDSINIGCMCGWDTDCNVGNIGAILGVMNGINGIDSKWIVPLNDFICLSSVLGSRNIQTISSLAEETVALSKHYFEGEPLLDIPNQTFNANFSLPYATNSFNSYYVQPRRAIEITKVSTEIHDHKPCLKSTFSNIEKGISFRTAVRTYFFPHDFHDNRYDPSFSPIVYPGQTMSSDFSLFFNSDNEIDVALYVKFHDGTIEKSLYKSVKSQQKINITYNIPSVFDKTIMEIGLDYQSGINLPIEDKAVISYLYSFSVSGQPNYGKYLKNSTYEIWHSDHKMINEFTTYDGQWELLDHGLRGTSLNNSAEIITGSVYFSDYQLETVIIPKYGSTHGILLSYLGNRDCYVLLFDLEKISLVRRIKEDDVNCMTVDYQLKHNEPTAIKVVVLKNQILVTINNETKLIYESLDEMIQPGQFGFMNKHNACTDILEYSVSPC